MLIYHAGQCKALVMVQEHVTTPLASAPGAKILNRQKLAKHLSLSLRYIDELTKNGTLPFYKIGKSVRYDLSEVEATMRQRFHVQAKPRKQSNKGTQPAA